MAPPVVTAIDIAVNVEISIDVDITVDVSGVDIAINVPVASDAAVHILTAANAGARYVAICEATAGSLRSTTSSHRTATGPSRATSAALWCGRQSNRNEQTSNDDC